MHMDMHVTPGSKTNKYVRSVILIPNLHAVRVRQGALTSNLFHTYWQPGTTAN